MSRAQKKSHIVADLNLRACKSKPLRICTADCNDGPPWWSMEISVSDGLSCQIMFQVKHKKVDGARAVLATISVPRLSSAHFGGYHWWQLPLVAASIAAGSAASARHLFSSCAFCPCSAPETAQIFLFASSSFLITHAQR